MIDRRFRGGCSGWPIPLAGEEAEVRFWKLIGLMAREGVMQALFKRLWRDDCGEDSTEYMLAVLLVALAVTAGMLLFPTEINEVFNKAGRVLINWI